MVWVLISSLISQITLDIHLSKGEISMVTAIPVILGSLLRIPLGYLTNRFGARLMFMISFILLLFPVFWISIADSLFDLIAGGFFLGIGGAVFSIGVTSLPKYYPKEKHGVVNGIYGAGNIGTAITTFAAPVIAQAAGWKATVQMYMVLVAVFALLHVLFGDRHEKKECFRKNTNQSRLPKSYLVVFEPVLFYYVWRFCRLHHLSAELSGGVLWVESCGRRFTDGWLYCHLHAAQACRRTFG